MNEEPELEINDTAPDDNEYLTKRRRIESGKSKFLPIALGILLVLVFAGGIFYFLSRQSAVGEANPLESKMTALEERIAGMEKQVAELQEKISASAPDKNLLQRMDVLAQKMETLEKQKRSATETKEKSSPPPKPAASTERQYHKVQKGETLQRISKKYGISVERLRKLNKLSPNQNPRTGQMLLVSGGQ